MEEDVCAMSTHTGGCHCGIKSFYIPRSHPDGVSVNVRCLDPDTIAGVTVTPFDGRNWEQNVAELSPIND
jgi:hypothetical protein